MSHRTAIARRGPSRPLLDLLPRLRQSWGDPTRKRWLDYGCGRGKDVEHLRSLGVEAYGYDPYQDEYMFLPFGQFDVVTCTYVLNVIMDRKERYDALVDAVSRVKPGGVFVVTVRNDVLVEAFKNDWTQRRDGYITGSGTFQVQLRSTELQEAIDRAAKWCGVIPLLDWTRQNSKYQMLWCWIK